MSNPLLEYHNEMKKIKEYERNIPGTVVLSIVVLIGTSLFVYRMFGLLLNKCSWAILNSYFVPPVQLLIYSMMIVSDPSEHVDILCVFGKIFLPAVSFLYCAYMMYMSYIHSSPLELAFYIFLALVEMTMLLDASRPGVSLFRPFLRRPAGVVEEERHAVVRKFKMGEPTKLNE